MIKDYTIKLPDYTDTMTRIVGDYTQIGRVKSNKGGYQSALLEPEDMPDSLKKCIDYYVHVIDNTVNMIHWWINVNGKSHANNSHDHHDRTPPAEEVGVSGVFYVSVPEKNMGDIVFQGTVMSSNPTIFDPPKKFEPQSNRLLLFPSDCFHSVEPNQSDKERISLAFNYTR
jgi:uncharacterized protein (TIGR02466 family)